MTDYCIIFEDPDTPDAPAIVLTPSDEWMDYAMAGNLPPISVYLALHDAEQQAITEGRHQEFEHDHDMWMQQFTAPRIGPLTEKEAIEYLIMKDIPKRVWGKEHNRQMLRIVTKNHVPSDRQFRNAWTLAEQ